MKTKAHKIVKYIPSIIVFLAVFGVFITANKNPYGFYTFKDNTFFLLENSLYKINHKDYSSLNEGDTIYYYEKTGNNYTIKSDKLIFKSATSIKPVYVLSSKPDEVISSERIIGKLSLKSSVLGVFLKVLTSRVFYFMFLILPLMGFMTYRFYNVISLPEEERIKTMPKVREDFVPLPKRRIRSQLLTRAQSRNMQKGFS